MTYGMSPDPEPDASIVEYIVNDDNELEFAAKTEFFLSEIIEYYNYDAGSAGGGGGGIMPLSAQLLQALRSFIITMTDWVRPITSATTRLEM